MLKVLLIAPAIDGIQAKDSLSAIQSAVNTLGAKLNIPRDRFDVRRGITKHNPDVIIAFTHGSSNGIWAGDEEISPETLSQYVRGRSVSLIILMSCESKRVAESIHSATGCDVIHTTLDISSTDAEVFLGRWFEVVSEGKTFRQAWAAAKTDGISYIPENWDVLADIEERLVKLEIEMSGLRSVRSSDNISWAIIVGFLLLAIVTWAVGVFI